MEFSKFIEFCRRIGGRVKEYQDIVECEIPEDLTRDIHVDYINGKATIRRVDPGKAFAPAEVTIVNVDRVFARNAYDVFITSDVGKILVYNARVIGLMRDRDGKYSLHLH